MADDVDRGNELERKRAPEDSSPAPLPRSEPNARDDQFVDPELQVIEKRIGRLIRQELLVVREEIRSEIHIGPLPHERTLEAYERIVPGSAKMIFDNFEEQGKHRRAMEGFALKWGTVRSFAGLASGLIVTLVFLWVSYLLIEGGHEIAGTILGTLNLVGLVTVFVYGSYVLRDERVQKARIMAGKDESEDDGKEQKN